LSKFTLDIDRIVDFVCENGGGIYTNCNRVLLKDYIKKHIEYGTFMTVSDPRGIAAVARWNWVDDKTAEILDVIIREDVRSFYTLKGLIMLGVRENPNCKYIKFERRTKYPERDYRTYKVEDLLRR